MRRIPYRALSLAVSVVLLVLGDCGPLSTRRIGATSPPFGLNLDPILVALACGIYWLQYPFNSIRLQRVILWTTGRSALEIASLRFFFKVTCSSGFVAAAAPIGLAGDAAKIAALRLFGSLSITEATRCALFDRVVGVQWLCLIGLATLPFQGAAGLSAEIILPQLAIFGAPIVGVGVLLALPAILARIRGALDREDRPGLCRISGDPDSFTRPPSRGRSCCSMSCSRVGHSTCCFWRRVRTSALADCRVHSAAAAREWPSVPLHGLGRPRDCYGEHDRSGG